MSRRLAAFVAAAALSTAILAPATSLALTEPGVRPTVVSSNWFSGLWNQLINPFGLFSEFGIQIDGDGFASPNIESNGHESEFGIQIDGDGRQAPAH